MVTMQTTRGNSRQINFVQYPFWVNVTEQAGNRAHPVTSSFGGMDLFWPSPLEIKEIAGVEALTLFFSSAGAWLETRDFNVDPNQSYLWTREQPDTLGAHPLAASLSGRFPSYFKDKPKPVREGDDTELPELPAQASESRVIVVGDMDFATAGLLQNTGGGRNLEFLVKAADWLGNDDDIIAIRGKPQGSGRLDRITDPEKRAAATAFSKAAGYSVPSLIAVLLAIFLALARKRRQRSQGGSQAGSGQQEGETK
jgi:ABC-type uncharacterized transport system involved in gliding motility auxiliary subunit